MNNSTLILQIPKTQPNININDLFQITAIGTSIGSPLLMQEICKATRTQAGEFKQAGNILDSTLNLKTRLLNDYIDNSAYPIEISATGINEFWAIIFEATTSGVVFEVTAIPSYVTYVNNSESGALTIESVEVLEADSSPCTYCKNKVTLQDGDKGTPPYKITFPYSSISDLTAEELEFPIARNLGFNNSNYSFYVIDANSAIIEGVISGMQSSVGNVSAEFFAVDVLVGTVRITTQLGEAAVKDQAIILEARITNEAGSGISPWTVISDSTLGEEIITEFDDIPLGTVKVDYRDNFGCTKVGEDTLTPLDSEGVTEVIYPLSNSLGFIDKDSYLKPAHFTTRRFCDLEIRNMQHKPYFQKFLKTSNLWIQFQTLYDSIEVILIDSNYQKTDISSSAQIIDSEEGYVWWKITPNLTNLEGIYSLKVTFSSAGLNSKVYLSEFFQVRDSYERTVLVSWKNEQGGYGYPDGILWGSETQDMIIDAEFVTFDNASEKSIMIDTNNKIINLDSKNSVFDNLNIFNIPYYLKERFILGLGHYEFYVNGIAYQTEKTPEIDAYIGSLLYKGEVQLRRVTYEIY